MKKKPHQKETDHPSKHSLNWGWRLLHSWWKHVSPEWFEFLPTTNSTVKTGQMEAWWCRHSPCATSLFLGQWKGWRKKHTESQEWKTKLYPLPFYPDFLVSAFLVSPLPFLCSDQNNNNIKVPYFLVNLYAFSHSPVGYEGSGWHGYLLTCPSSCLVSPGWDVSGSSCLDDAPQTVIHVPTLPLTAALHFLLKFSFISVIQPLNTNFNLFQENKFSSAQDDVAIGWSVSILGRDIDYFF